MSKTFKELQARMDPASRADTLQRVHEELQRMKYMRTALRFFAQAVAALGLCPLAFSQTGGTPTAFEVAAIKHSIPLEELHRLMAAGRAPSVGILVRNNLVYALRVAKQRVLSAGVRDGGGRYC